MKKLYTILLVAVLLLSVTFTGFGYASIVKDMEISGTVSAAPPDGVFISGAEIIDQVGADTAATAINYYLGVNLSSSIKLSPSDGDSYVTVEVTFYNNSDKVYIYSGAEHLGEAYDNISITYDTGTPHPLIDPNDFLTIEITFAYADGEVASNQILNSLINFNFTEISEPTISVSKGNSSDNVHSVYDGYTTFNASTAFRWTNWSPNASDRGSSVVMDMVWLEEVTFDMIDLYYFVDGEGCDFPSTVAFQYYDEESGEYIDLPVTATKYYRNEEHAKNRYGYWVYNMDIDSSKNGRWSSIVIQDGYVGHMPMESFKSQSKITTRNLRILIDGKDADESDTGNAYFVGLVEMKFFNGTTQVTTR
ncbi:MAG: hypothetical protein IJY18_01655 [Clostridia bacterium]|nr:hypothetical protein [Clostridia bacterium]